MNDRHPALSGLAQTYVGRDQLPDHAEITDLVGGLSPLQRSRLRTEPELVPAQVLAALARRRIREAYESRQLWRTLGLPVDGNLDVVADGDGHRAELRSGVLVLDAGGTLVEHKTNEVIVRLAGIECRRRQEKADELYAVISLLGPANQHRSELRVPGSGTITLGPEGNRLLPIAQELYRGPIEDLYLVVALVENDSGDPDVVAEKIITRLREISSKVASVAGLPAEAVAQTESLDEDLISGLGFLLGEVFGIGDDPYDAVSKLVRWQDQQSALGRGFPTQRAVRGDDVRVIDRFTHTLDLSGTDHGGDPGNYRFFFEIAVQTTTVS